VVLLIPGHIPPKCKNGPSASIVTEPLVVQEIIRSELTAKWTILLVEFQDVSVIPTYTV
jgi:hypothetical protein